MAAEPPAFGPDSLVAQEDCGPGASELQDPGPDDPLGPDVYGPRDVSGLDLSGIDRFVVLGGYWNAPGAGPPDLEPVRTEVGELVHRAKDLFDEAAAAELGRRLTRLVRQSLPSQADLVPLVVGVPSYPTPAIDLPAVLAAALAAAGMGEHRPGLLVRRSRTQKLRDLGADAARRLDTVAAAGYEVTEPVAGRSVVLVDDVVLTGTTLWFIAAKLQAAGADLVTAVATARTRRR